MMKIKMEDVVSIISGRLLTDYYDLVATCKMLLGKPSNTVFSIEEFSKSVETLRDPLVNQFQQLANCIEELDAIVARCRHDTILAEQPDYITNLKNRFGSELEVDEYTITNLPKPADLAGELLELIRNNNGDSTF